MKEAIDAFVNGPPHVYLGLVCDYGAAPVTRQAIFWNTAVVTTGALALDFHLRRRTMYMTTTRAGPANVRDMTLAIQALQGRMNWKRVFVLYERNGQGDIMPNLCHLIAETVVFTMRERGVYTEYLTLEFDWREKMQLNLIFTEKIGDKFAGRLHVFLVFPFFSYSSSVTFKAHTVPYPIGIAILQTLAIRWLVPVSINVFYLSADILRLNDWHNVVAYLSSVNPPCWRLVGLANVLFTRGSKATNVSNLRVSSHTTYLFNA